MQKIVKSYDDFFKGYKSQIYRYNFFAKLIKKYKSTGELLDVGCAHGYFLKFMQNRYVCSGIEYDAKAAKVAKGNTNAKIYNCSVEKIKAIKSNTFDIITCFDVLEHVKDLNAAVSELSRVSKKEVMLIISVPNTNSLGHKLKKKDWFGYRDRTHISLLTSKSWEKLFTKNKFKIIDEFYEGYFDIPYFKGPQILQKAFLIPGLFMYKTGIKVIPKNGENIVFILKKE